MVDPATLERKLKALERYLSKLEGFGQHPEEVFIADEAMHDLAAHYLHLAVEVASDIGNHIIADQGLSTPDSYRDIFHILASAEHLDAELAERLGDWASFRNVLVHDYLEVDFKLVFSAIRDELSDLHRFASHVARKFL